MLFSEVKRWLEQKNGTYLNVCSESSIYERLRELCAHAGQTKTVAVDRALFAYLDDYERKRRRLKGLDKKA